jgi:hypothetical protein
LIISAYCLSMQLRSPPELGLSPLAQQKPERFALFGPAIDRSLGQRRSVRPTVPVEQNVRLTPTG